MPAFKFQLRYSPGLSSDELTDKQHAYILFLFFANLCLTNLVSFIKRFKKQLIDTLYPAKKSNELNIFRRHMTQKSRVAIPAFMK